MLTRIERCNGKQYFHPTKYKNEELKVYTLYVYLQLSNDSATHNPRQFISSSFHQQK